MKTRLALLITAALLAVGLPIPAHAADAPFFYTVSGGEVTINGYNGTAPTNLVIPETIEANGETYPVVSIGYAAFAGKRLTSVDLPNTLTTIGSSAFNENQLTELDLPNALTTINGFAFYDNKLNGVTLPNTLTSLDAYAFASNQLTELTLPNNITTISEGAFNHNQLTELDLPGTLTSLGGYAFSYNQLTELDLPGTLTSVGEYAFSYNQLAELTLPNNITSVGKYAFDSNQLAELTLPDALTSLGEYAFASNQLTELDLPDTLTTISRSAFASNQLAKLDLPNALTTISGSAFASNKLTELTLPGTLTSLGASAFYDNPLAAVRFTGQAPQLGLSAFGNNGDLQIRFPWKFRAPSTTDGYTTPTWNGYDTIAIADVTFAGGGDIDAQSIDVDGTSTAAKPADPAKTGQMFTGWFTDTATAPFDFTKPVTGDVVLTAAFELPTVPVPTVPTSPVDPAISGLDPAIVGNAREGKTLTAKPGTLTPSGTTATYQWRANGKAIKGATKSSLKLRKAQAGKRITVTITAKATGTPTVSKTSAKTKPVASAKRRLALSTYRVAKNEPFTVTATGFKAGQKVIIWLGGDIRYTGRADSRGAITKAVTFAKDTKAGVRRVRVSGYQNDGNRDRTIHTTVRYR